MNAYKDFGQMFTVGFDVMSVSLDPNTKVPIAQIGSSVDQTVESDGAELWQQPGLASIPAAPTQGSSSCQGIALKRSDRDIIFACRDTRASTIYGNLLPGETCLYATSGQARCLLKADGHVVLYTTDGNSPSGQSVAVSLGPDSSVSMASKYGAISISSSGITMMFGTSSGIQIDSSGVTLIGQSVRLNGGNVVLGAGAGLPVAITTAGPVNVVSTSVFASP